jgi:hypothetical protein
MYDLRSYRDTALSERVRCEKYNYFMSEIDNIDLLMALVKEEYLYTDIQLEILNLDLAFLIATRLK